MNTFGKRVPKGNLLLFFSFTAVSLCILLIISMFHSEYENRLSHNNLYTGHQKEFSVCYAEDENQWRNVIPNIKSDADDFAIYVPVQNPDIILRGVYIKGNVVRPPMIQGEYFDCETSWTEVPKAVLGKKYQKDTRTENGKLFYEYNGVDYEVIGVMGTQKDSWINKMIMLDFNSAVKLSGINTSYVLDTKRKSNINKTGQELCNMFQYPASLMITLEEGVKSSFVEEFFSSDVIMDTMYIMILISFSLSTVLVTYIWLSYRKQLFFAWELCGYRKICRHYEIYKRFLGVAVTGFLSGLLLMYIFSYNIRDIDFKLMYILQSFLFTVCLGVVIFTFCYIIDFRKVRRK